MIDGRGEGAGEDRSARTRRVRKRGPQAGNACIVRLERRSSSRRIFAAHAPHLPAGLLRSSLTHPRMGSLRSSSPDHHLGHLDNKSLADYLADVLARQMPALTRGFVSEGFRTELARALALLGVPDAGTQL